MRLRSVFIALIGVSLAGGSAYAAREYVDRGRPVAETEPNDALVQLVVANTDITFGQAIHPQMLKTIAWPREAVPPGAVMNFDDLVAPAGGQPRRATTRIFAGELVLMSKVSAFGEKVTIVQSLMPNTRAMAIKVDATTAVGGFVTPGDFVDIVLTQGAQSSLTAMTILQNIRVVGVDQQADETTEAANVASTVTVEVTAEQGQKLALAQKAGTLSLTLRTLDSADNVPLEQVRLSDLLASDKPAATAGEDVVEAVPATIRVRRGNELTFESVN